MKHISLVRTDEEAEAINISLGEAVIGRGPLLNCIDKRISRNHGLIKLSEKGDVVLTSKHLNPIYYTEKTQPSVEIHSGNSVTLHDGDEFALLPDCYRFRVAISSNNKVQNNGCINGETVIDKERVKEVEKTECTKIKQEIESQSENTVACSYRCTVDSNRNRNLPTWMTSNGADTPGSAAVKKERKRKEAGKNETTNKKAKATPKKKKTDELSNENDELSSNNKETRITPKKKKTDELSDEDEIDELLSEDFKGCENKKTEKVCKEDDKNEMDVDKTGASSTSVNKTKLHELSDDDGEEEEKNNKDVADSTKEQATSSDKKKLDVKDESKDKTPNLPVQNATANNTRQKCLYGANCYRTNPQHRTDFSHPGDADYDENNIPECPYGLLCYRKNKLHRLDYKHTTMPQQQNTPQNKKRKNTGTRKNYADDDDDDDDDYDYDDPFLNDASSDDYQPTDSDSGNSAPSSDGEEEQDTKRMLKEAKKFTRKKK